MTNHWVNHWMFKCKDISALVSRSMDTKLPLHQRLGIKVHLMMCHLCRQYKNQLTLLSAALKTIDPVSIKSFDIDIYNTSPDESLIIPLPDSIKKEIQDRLNHQLHRN